MTNKRDNNELVMETTYGRGKAKTEFKAVINKVLAGALALSALIGGSGVSAFAADNNLGNIRDTVNSIDITQDTTTSIRNTIKAIETMKKTGSVSDALINQLANEVSALQMNYTQGTSIDTIAYILDSAESAISGLSNAGPAEAAIVAARTMLGLSDTHAVEQAKANPTSFTDLDGHWGYDNIMAMTSRGLFSGYEDGSFRPDNPMSKVEFLMVVCRILNLDTSTESTTWWDGAYNAGLQAGLIRETETPRSSMEDKITRQEMAMISVRAMGVLGENTDAQYEDNVKASISDFNSVLGLYRDYVVKAYSKGVITGYPDSSFKPNGNATRAEASTVLNKITDTGARTVQDFSQAPVKEEVQSGPITIYEGQIRENSRIAQEGDTVIKASTGEAIVLRKGVHGIVGEGQGVSPDLGYTVSGVGNTTVVATNIDDFVFSGDTTEVDSTGDRINNQPYYVNQVTGEGHWGSEWQAITSMPTTDGAFHYQLSEDKNWMWNDVIKSWTEISVQNIGPKTLASIMEANGLK